MVSDGLLEQVLYYLLSLPTCLYLCMILLIVLLDEIRSEVNMILQFRQWSLIIRCFPELNDQIDSLNKEHKELLKNLEYWKGQERDHQERISEDSKELEKMTNKQSLLLKKVCLEDCTEIKSLLKCFICISDGFFLK